MTIYNPTGSGGGGTPGGSSNSIQYNNAGSFGGFGAYHPTGSPLGGTAYVDLFNNGKVEIDDNGDIKLPGAGSIIFDGGGAGIGTFSGDGASGFGFSSNDGGNVYFMGVGNFILIDIGSFSLVTGGLTVASIDSGGNVAGMGTFTMAGGNWYVDTSGYGFYAGGEIAFDSNAFSGPYSSTASTALGTDGTAKFLRQAAFGMYNPLYEVDIYDAQSTGTDIGNSTTGLWNINNLGVATFNQLNYSNGTPLSGSGGLLYGNGNFLSLYGGELDYPGPGTVALADSSNNLYYGNAVRLADNSGNLYYGSGNLLADSSGDLYYGNGNSLAGSSGNLYYSNGAPLADTSENLYATKFITTGGTTSQVVLGDGTLGTLIKGSTTLVAGTKAISISGLTSSNHAFVTVTAPGGTLGTTYKAVCTTNTLTITSVGSTGTTITTDTSTLNYLVV